MSSEKENHGFQKALLSEFGFSIMAHSRQSPHAHAMTRGLVLPSFLCENLHQADPELDLDNAIFAC